MEPNFDWQTEEDQEDVWSPGEPGQPDGRGRRWPVLLFVVLAVGSVVYAGYRIYRQMGAQADEATAAVREEVRAGYRVLRQAAENGDRELFLTFLSGRDPEWTAAQVDVLQAGRFLERPGLGLRLLPSHQLTVTISPELTSAEIEVRQSYAVTTERGVTETVRLRQSALFRRGEEQWLYAPPEDPEQFWGQEERFQGSLVTVTFPQRDEETARAIAADLEGTMAALCSLVHIDCPAGWRLVVNLEHAPNALLEPVAGGVPEGAQEVVLPAPTLVGLPLDEAGYRALFRGYAGQVVARALADLYPLDECCAYAPFREGLVAWHLARLDLRAHPVVPADYLQLLERMPLATRLEAVSSALNVRDAAFADRVLASVLVEFLMGGAADGVRAERVMKRPAVTPESVSIWFPERSFRTVDRAWRDFLFEQAALAQDARAAVPPVPLPDQDLLLACGDEAGRETALVRYDVDEGRWLQLHVFDGRGLYMSPLPHDQGALVYLVPEGETVASIVGRTIIWRPRETLILDSVRGEVISPVRGWRRNAEDPRGEFVTIFSRSREGEETYWLLSLPNCDADDCDAEEVPGLPIWSPDGSRVAAYDGELHVSADRRGEEWTTMDGRISMVGHPAWLGDEAVAYQWNAVRARSREDGRRRTVVDPGALSALLPEARKQGGVIVDDFHVHPADPNTLFVVAEEQGTASMIFRMQRPPDAPSFFDKAPSPDEIDLLWEVDDPSLRIVDVTLNGRWLMAETFADDPAFLVYDVSRGQQVFVSPDNFRVSGGWDIVADERWLVHVRVDFVELVALAEREGDVELYRRIIFPDYDLCTGAVWISFPETAVRDVSAYRDEKALSRGVSAKRLQMT